MGFIKDRARAMREKEEKGEEVDRELAPDPMLIKEDVEQENFMDELVDKDEEGDISEDRDDNSKSDAERGEPTDVSLAEGNEEPPAKEAEVETEPVVGDLDTGTEVAKSKDVIPEDDGVKHKVDTVYGNEELTLGELKKGYMRTAHYTQVSQENAQMRKQLTHILSDPKNVVEYAVANGMDLRQFVQAETVIPEFNMPEPDQFATDEVKANYAFMKRMWQANQELSKEVSGIRNSSKLSKLGQENDQLEREFGKIRGDVPESAAHAVYALYMAGVRRYGKEGYSMKGAIRDYKIAEGDVTARFLESPKGKAWHEAEKRRIIAEYVAGKEKTKDATLSPDSLPAGKKVPPAGPPKIRSIAEGLAMAKKKFGIK